MADEPPPPATPTPMPMPLPSAPSSAAADGEPGSAAGSPQDPTTPPAAFPSSAGHQQTVESLSDFEVDSGHSSDSDSALGSEVSSLSTAFTASNYDFRFENGRRYQSANDKYLLPNDAQEMNRLELQHMIWMELLGNRLYLAPLQKIHMTHALDVGCGTGNWTMEFAAQHPHVQVIGTDLSPIQPEYVPVNCTFYLDDATRAWAFHQRFDYVHGRMLTFGIGDWDGFVDQAYAHLQPGGFLELQEWRVPLVTPDGSLRPQHALARWIAALMAACTRLGLDIRASADHADRMRRRGFAGVVERRLGVPVGPWAKGERQKRLGWMGRRDLLEALDAISKRLFPRAGIMTDFAEIDAFLRDVRDDMFDSTIHAIVPLDVVVGQRPFDG